MKVDFTNRRLNVKYTFAIDQTRRAARSGKALQGGVAWPAALSKTAGSCLRSESLAKEGSDQDNFMSHFGGAAGVNTVNDQARSQAATELGAEPMRHKVSLA